MSINNRLINTGGGGGEPALDGQRQIYFYNTNTYISNDYGSTFTEIADLSGGNYYTGYISGNGLHIIVWKQYGQKLSNDGGNSWSDMGGIVSYNSGYSISDDGQYIARTGNGQAYYSTDGGASFSQSSGENGGADLRSDPTGQYVKQLTPNTTSLQYSSNYGASYSLLGGVGSNQRRQHRWSRYLNFLVYGSSYSYYGYVNDNYSFQIGGGSNAWVYPVVNGGKPDASVRYYMWLGSVDAGFYVSGLNSTTTTYISTYGRPNAMAVNGSGQYRTITTPSGTYTSSDYGVTWVSNGDGISAGNIIINQGDF